MLNLYVIYIVFAILLLCTLVLVRWRPGQQSFFDLTALKEGQKVWCRMERGHVYEIEYLGDWEMCRCYRLRKLVMSESGPRCTDVHEKVHFRSQKVEVGCCFVCYHSESTLSLTSSLVAKFSQTELVPEHCGSATASNVVL